MQNIKARSPRLTMQPALFEVLDRTLDFAVNLWIALKTLDSLIHPNCPRQDVAAFPSVR